MLLYWNLRLRTYIYTTYSGLSSAAAQLLPESRQPSMRTTTALIDVFDDISRPSNGPPRPSGMDVFRERVAALKNWNVALILCNQQDSMSPIALRKSLSHGLHNMADRTQAVIKLTPDDPEATPVLVGCPGVHLANCWEKPVARAASAVFFVLVQELTTARTAALQAPRHGPTAPVQGAA